MGRKRKCCTPPNDYWHWDAAEHPGAHEPYAGDPCYVPIAGVSQGFCIDNGALLIALVLFLCLCGFGTGGLTRIAEGFSEVLQSIE